MAIEMWRRRGAFRGQAGLSTPAVVLGLGGSLTVAALLALSGQGQVDAAQGTVCQYEKSVIMTAVESWHASSDDGDYPTPAGGDGLDQVRSDGWLRMESRYWRYAGVGADHAPQYVLRSAINGCA